MIPFALTSIVTGTAIASGAWAIMSYATKVRSEDPERSRFEAERRSILNSRYQVYGLFEGLISELAENKNWQESPVVVKIRRDLISAQESPAWTPQEYLAYSRVNSILIAVAVGAAIWFLFSLPSAIISAVLTWVFMERNFRKSLEKRANMRRWAIKRRLVNSLELLAIIMEVGGTFSDGISSIVSELKSHALGDELALLLQNINSGRSLPEAIAVFDNRINDEDVSEFSYAVTKSHELGTPLAGTLRQQAEQLREKRLQWAEKISEQAKVSIVFPAMLIMLACLIIVAAPFILTAFVDYKDTM